MIGHGIQTPVHPCKMGCQKRYGRTMIQRMQNTTLFQTAIPHLNFQLILMA